MGLHSNRRERTGHQYGIVTVVRPDPENQTGWIIHWRCCDRLQSVAASRVRDLEKSPVTRCQTCQRHNQAVSPATLAQRARDKQLRDARQAAEAAPPEGVHIPGSGFWPALKGPFGRLYQNGHESIPSTPAECQRVRRHLTPEDHADIHRLYRDGQSNRQIAETLGFAKDTVNRVILQMHGRRRGRPSTVPANP